MQRVFFRQDDGPLDLTLANPGLTDQERDEIVIADEVIGDAELGKHVFWPDGETEKNGKRKANVNGVNADGAGEREGESSADDSGEHDRPRKKRKVV